MGLGRESAARYTSEGHLSDLVEQHGLNAVWAAAAAVIDADPAMLDRSSIQRVQDRAGREAHVESLVEQALAALYAGDHMTALGLVDQAELVDPRYQPGRTDRRPYGYDWGDIRAAIRRRPDPPGSPGARTATATAVASVSLVAPGSHTIVPATAAHLARLDTTPTGASRPVVGAVAQGARPPSVPATGRRVGHRV